MKKLEEKRQFLIGTVLLVVMVFFYLNMLLAPLVKKFREVGALGSQYRRDVTVTEAGLARMEQIKEEIQRLEGRLGETQRRFPSEREPLLEELSEIAENGGIKILEMTPGKKESSTRSGGAAGFKELAELPITISAEGGYHEFGMFVNALENSERIYLIQDLSIKSNPEKERVHSFRLELKAMVKEETRKP